MGIMAAVLARGTDLASEDTLRRMATLIQHMRSGLPPQVRVQGLLSFTAMVVHGHPHPAHALQPPAPGAALISLGCSEAYCGRTTPWVASALARACPEECGATVSADCFCGHVPSSKGLSRHGCAEPARYARAQVFEQLVSQMDQKQQAMLQSVLASQAPA